MSSKNLYRITYSFMDSVYEIYARKLCESEMFGFLEVEELVFGEHTSVVVDPSEERLKREFSGVKRTYIPMHAVFRIDEVDKIGEVKITDQAKKQNTVSVLPVRNKLTD